MMIMAITDNYKAIRRSVRDRWVWLVLGVILFFLSFILGATAHAASVAQAQPDDQLVEMIRTSGPAGGLVLILGWFIRTWQADLKNELRELRGRLDGAAGIDSELRTTQASLRAEVNAIDRRVEKLERRASGPHPRGD